MTVTVVCATRNALDAVRLTFSSFRRYTPEPCVVLVADNGSTDGTLEYLRSLRWLTVFPLEQRVGDGPGQPTGHGPTLDWLAARVETEWFLTLDSDVEFLHPNWLSRMLELAEGEDLVALGELEPAVVNYRARLAPYVLLLRTAAFASLATSFQGFTRFEDPEEARRFVERGQMYRIDASELAEYPGATLYPTAARLLEELERSGSRWQATPAEILGMYRHIGHMSWGGNDEPIPGADAFRAEYDTGLAYVRERLRLYEPQP